MTPAVPDPPLVSVVVPVLNGERYLAQSLDSILAQTYRPIEVLVMDDASADGTSRVVASYGGAVRYYRQRETRGIYANVNDGLARVGGAYVAVYHADDVYLPTIVEREAAFLDRYPAAGAVFCADIFVDALGREYGRLELPFEVRGGRPLRYPVILNALLTHKNRFLPCPSSMVRASVYREVGPYRQDRFRNNADLEMWLRIARRHAIGIVEEHLFRYRHHAESSARRSRHLRTEPERHFAILDQYLADGGREIATPAALAAHGAHRAEDWLMIAVHRYILGLREPARAALAAVRVRTLLGSRRVQRGRLLLLLLAMQALLRVPRIGWVANRLYRHWYPDGAPEPAAAATTPTPSGRREAGAQGRRA